MSVISSPIPSKRRQTRQLCNWFHTNLHNYTLAQLHIHSRMRNLQRGRNWERYETVLTQLQDDSEKLFFSILQLCHPCWDARFSWEQMNMFHTFRGARFGPSFPKQHGVLSLLSGVVLGLPKVLWKRAKHLLPPADDIAAPTATVHLSSYSIKLTLNWFHHLKTLLLQFSVFLVFLIVLLFSYISTLLSIFMWWFKFF